MRPASAADWPERYVIRAQQLLTMTGWDGKPPLQATLAAIEGRDAAILGLCEDMALTIRGPRVENVAPFATRPDPTLPVVLHTPLAMPAWLECHTHSLFAGERSREFAIRNTGVDYAEILEAGGGILSTVATSREASDEALFDSLLARVEDFARRGVGCVEVKTGYGLSLEHELRHLAIIGQVAECSTVKVVPTFLGAHTIPAEWRHDRGGYLTLLLDALLPKVAEQGIAQFCDVFCDRGAFDLQESKRILERAAELGLKLKIHAEELTYTGGAAMAAGLGAVSADHCDHLRDEDVAALAAAGTTAVLLPGVTLFLDLAKRAPARRLIDGGAAVALSTDFNPGSCMTQDLGLMTTLGCTLLKMTPGEALWAVTAGASRALAFSGGEGLLVAGGPADVACFDVDDYRSLPYRFGENHVSALVLGGVRVV